MIPNNEKENDDEEPYTISSHFTVLGTAVKEVNAIEYQDLKNIALGQRTKQKNIKVGKES